ncbi:hypothetical protein HPP92_015787 [Vanilla planifolia]|uniref:WAT1-related protein n=1 Tax=Vanilla planifolia TaxID=51239 RepID=A0A835QHY9_VANPL|nr:hypothetical protein HPP92_015787 [Vanilla planifolia]
MENIIPAITYIMALLLRVETLDMRRRGGQLKITGTLLTVSGAVLLILYKGPMLDFLWFSKGVKQQAGSLGQSSNGGDPTSLMWIRGMIMLIGSTTCWSGFLILQSNTLESYPAELTITSLVCLMGAAASGAVAFLVERGNTAIWVIGWDMRLFTVVYSGIICTGVSYYVLGMVMKEKGPVFASAFSPLCTIITSLMSSIFLSETISLGMTIGAFIMIGGLYFLLWGKTKEELKFSQAAAVEASVITCDQVPNAEFEQENNYKSGSLPMESSYV